MKIFVLLTTVLFSSHLLASPDVCTYAYNAKATTLSWTAFKTPKKAPVKVKFEKFKIKATKAPTVEGLFAAATFEVNSQSVNSGDKARDAKIMNFFFKKMTGGKSIKGKVLSATKEALEVEFNMNGVKKTVPMTIKFDEASGTATLNGSIDVLEFSMKDHLATLTKACNVLHEGVTWPNVDLELVTVLTKSCK